MKTNLAKYARGLVLPLILALTCSCAVTGCDQSTINATPEQIAQFQASQKAQSDALTAKVQSVENTVKGVTAVAAPVAAVIPGAQPVAAALPLAGNLVDIIGGALLAGFGLWQKWQASKYKASGESMIAAIDRVTAADPAAGAVVKQTVAKTSLQDGTADHLNGWVQDNSYSG